MIKWIAHRGNFNTDAIENSYEALLDSIHHPDIDGIELDVRLTKDHKVVVYHDATLERLSNGVGLVRDKTLKELKTYLIGRGKHHTTIPTLDEVLRDIRCSKKIMIELKDETGDYPILVDQVCKIIGRYQNLNLYLASFRYELLTYLQKKCRKVKIGIFVSDWINQSYLKNSFDFNVIKADWIDEVDLSKETFVWTVDDHKTLEKIKKGAHGKSIGIITNRPLSLKKEK